MQTQVVPLVKVVFAGTVSVMRTPVAVMLPVFEYAIEYVMTLPGVIELARVVLRMLRSGAAVTVVGSETVLLVVFGSGVVLVVVTTFVTDGYAASLTATVKVTTVLVLTFKLPGLVQTTC